jgi:hypothetical protein
MATGLFNSQSFSDAALDSDLGSDAGRPVICLIQESADSSGTRGSDPFSFTCKIAYVAPRRTIV